MINQRSDNPVPVHYNDLPFKAQLTAWDGGNLYTWVEVQATGSTTPGLVAMDSGRYGSITSTPAFELNGKVLPLNSYVIIQRSYYSVTLGWVYSILGTTSGTSEVTTGTFVIPAVGSTANVTTVSTAGLTVNDFISITDGTNLVYGYVQSITNPTTFVFKTAFVTTGAAGNTMGAGAVIHVCCKIPFAELTTATFTIPAYNSPVTVNVDKTTGLKSGMEVVIDDGTNVVYGFVSALTATSFTFTTTMITAGAAGNTMGLISTVLPTPVPPKTPVTASFTLPAEGSSVSVSAGSTAWMGANEPVAIWDGTDYVYGTAVPTSPTAFTFYPTLIPQGAAGNTIPAFTTVVPKSPPPYQITTTSITLPAVGTGVTVTVPTTTPYKDNQKVRIKDNVNLVDGFITILTATTFTFTPTYYWSGIPTNTMLTRATVTPITSFNEPIGGLKSADVASAGTTNLLTATGDYIHVTGTTTITALGTLPSGMMKVLVFDGALLLTHNGTSLILPYAANITTAAGDMATMRSEGGGNWRCVEYTRATDPVIVATDGATVTFDETKGHKQKVTLGGNRTLALSGDYDGMVFYVTLKQDGTGSRTVTWWSNILWPAGTTPTLTTTVNKSDDFIFIRVSSTEYHGFILGQNI